MSISGNLRTMPFPDLLQWVAQSRKTGTLAINGCTSKKKLYFKDGQVVATASDNPKEFLGYYLVGWNFVGEEELTELLDMQDRHGALIGELLVTIGRLSRDELARVLEIKTEETIFDLFMWSEGDFRFLDAVLPSKKYDPLDLSVDQLVLEGVRRLDEWQASRGLVGGGDWVPKIIGPLDVRALEPGQRGVLCEIDGDRTIEEIALARRIGTFDVWQFIVGGVRNGVFSAQPPGEAARPIPGFTKIGWRAALKMAEQSVAAGRLLEAYHALEELRARTTANRDAKISITGAEAEIEKIVSRSGVGENSVLELAIPPDELTSTACSREEGFLLSRVNGAYTIGQILSLLPGDSLEHRLVIHGLVTRGVLQVVG